MSTQCFLAAHVPSVPTLVVIAGNMLCRPTQVSPVANRALMRVAGTTAGRVAVLLVPSGRSLKAATPTWHAQTGYQSS